jgi:anti-sigma B factor antagonist
VSPDDSFRIKLLNAEGASVLAVAGELDLAIVPQLEAALEQLVPDRPAFIDVAGVTFLASSAIGAIVRHATRLGATGGSLQLRNPSEPIQYVLSVTGLTDLLERS